MSVKKKLTLVIAAIISVILATYMLHQWTMLNKNLKQQVVAYLSDMTVNMAKGNALESYTDRIGTDDSFIYIGVQEISAFRIQDGKPVMTGGTYNFRSGSDEQDSIIKASNGGAITSDLRFGQGEHSLVYYARLDRADATVVRIVFDLSRTDAIVGKELREELVVSVILLITLTVASYWLLGTIFKPLDTIVWKVQKVANGKFDDIIPVSGKDEFGQLANQMNNMSKNMGVYMNKLKRAFEDNRSMKDYLESFINHTTDAIHVFDQNGIISSTNAAFTQMFGYEEHEVIGRKLAFVPAQWEQEERKAMEALLAGKAVPPMESVRRKKSGEYISVSVTISPIRDTGGTIRAFASITRDMTSRNKMEELLRRSEKLTTVGKLAAGVAHEIRNPLTTLKGFLQLQMQTNKLNPQHIDMMMTELDRINLIVGEFLILAKPQATKFEVKDVRFVLGDVMSLLDSQAHLCSVIFQSEFTKEACNVHCEENQLKQVFINLLKNAMEAMPNGGNIKIAVELGDQQEVRIEIVDEGCGIPEEMIPTLGDPFVTGKEAGTGLGIMVSQRIIQSHRGTMFISSQVGVGTTVMITLPSGVDEMEPQHPLSLQEIS
ncbi:sensor histidine kinase [Paenibacillus kobensis]|uniref:sensor histidine kinase n=1 Tax=Paenibacillus kobensis TaxID=59841 RepID=UPI000FDC1C6F|nr:sensor histidine kinase [Paenibacillus kobensis]